MVPSDLIHSLALRRHARHRASQTGFQSGFSLAPRYRPSAATVQCSQVRLLVLPVRSRSLVAAFRSLGTTVRSPNHHSEVNVPGLLLRNPAELSSGPLTFCSPAWYGFDPATGGFNAQTRYLKSIQQSRYLFVSPLPVRAFVPFRIKAFDSIRSRASSPSGSARFPFAPRVPLS
jgi:hypothetical protein